MLFLLNAVVVKIPDVIQLPRSLGPLAQITQIGALNAGSEIYARFPRLEYDRPDIAEWYCGLLVAKFPDASGALFVRGPSGYVARLAEIPFPVLARLWTMQRRGEASEAEARHAVWSQAGTSTATG